MPIKNDNDSETVTDEMKPVNKMNSDERTDVGKKDVVTYNRTNRILTVEKKPIDTKDIDDDFMRKYDGMYKLMQYKQTCDIMSLETYTKHHGGRYPHKDRSE